MTTQRLILFPACFLPNKLVDPSFFLFIIAFIAIILSSFQIQPALALTVHREQPCQEPDVASLPFCNTSLPSLDRAQDIVKRLTLEEKVKQMMHLAPAIDKWHIPAYNWWSESLHGISAQCTNEEDRRCATSYPAPIGMGATFNMPLVKIMASQISSEGRRFFIEHLGNNHSNKLDTHLTGLDFWGPNINIFRDPRWGRGMETPGEDPYLTGQYAIMYVKGMQEGEDPRYYKTIATLKHFAAYSLEQWGGVGRLAFNAIVSDEDLAQTYLPAFQAGIQQGRAGSVMCSYNAVNGIPSCANHFLLQEILRDHWDWDGYVVSDCWAIQAIVDNHKYKHSRAEATAASIQAGTDLNCGSSYGTAAKAIQQGLLEEADLDKALSRLFQARIKLGMFDPWEQQPYMQYPPETIGHPDHWKTALQLARESIVLLKNSDNKALPLNPSTSTIRKVAVLGPHFNSTSALCGNYYGELPPITSPIQALTNAFAGHADVVGTKGCDINSTSTDNFDAATQLAGSADIAIVFVGLGTSIEREAQDRVDIDLPGVQEEFVKAVAKVQSKTILVLINGGAVDVSFAVENPNVVAILEAFYPGMRGGEAITDVLIGKYNPSGRLPYTIHKKDFVHQMAFLDMSMSNYPGRTYRYFRGDAVFPFGFGLSYTTFTYETESLEATSIVINATLGANYRVRVTNSGNVPGDISVLAFLSYKGSNEDFTCPKSQLFAFEKVHNLKPGESSEVFFTAAPTALRCVRKSDGLLTSPQGWYAVEIGDSQHTFLFETVAGHASAALPLS